MQITSLEQCFSRQKKVKIGKKRVGIFVTPTTTVRLNFTKAKVGDHFLGFD